jgi:cysteinyl-tRNA synthetase
MLKIYNTLSRSKENFEPANPPEVRMYVCGITSYDDCHLGHGRAYVVFDLIRRYLTYKGYIVMYVQNFTDIDDKILDRSRQLGQNWRELSENYQIAYFEVADKLNILKANFYPKATENIPEMISLIKKLIVQGLAYESAGNVYFEVRKFPDYGKLSGKNIDELESGARVEPNQQKKDPLDFALWKKTKPEEPFWESLWGPGRPGWHIECSAMAQKFLGIPFDIHGGGADLIFPHHENEIAQSEGASGNTLARYWLHNGFVTINKEKMSKSLGNFFTLKDIFAKYSPMVVRLFLISLHYRSPLDFSDDKLEEAKAALAHLQATADLIRQDFFLDEEINQFFKIKSDPNFLEKLEPETHDFKKQFEEALDDDFNSAQALAVLFNLSSKIENLVKGEHIQRGFWELLALFYRLTEDVLGIQFILDPLPAEIFEIIKKREIARSEKNWALSDELRKKCLEAGFEIQDTPEGPRWIRLIK